jgi:hypothetical protein
MPGLVWKIDGEASEDGVHGLDAPKSPAPVHTVAAGRERNQRFNVAALYLSSRGDFLEFLSHN